MRAWASSFGKPLLCLIEADGVPHAFCYEDDESNGERLNICELFPRGIVIVCGIESLSKETNVEQVSA